MSPSKDNLLSLETTPWSEALDNTFILRKSI